MPTLTNPHRYDTPADIQMRLSDGFVRYRGDAYFVREVLDGLRIRLYDVSLKDEDIMIKDSLVVHSSDVELDISSPPLGWCLSPRKGIPMYLMRSPRRSQKQAIVPKNLYVYTPGKSNPTLGFVPNRHPAGLVMGYNWQQWTDLIPLKKTIEGKFMTVSESIHSKAGVFDRNWMMLRPEKGKGVHTLFHKFIPVGSYIEDRNAFVFAAGALTKTRRSSIEEIIANQPGAFNVYEQSV